MEAKYSWLNSLLNQNRSDFARWPELKWANDYNVSNYQDNRTSLIQNAGMNLLFNDTKPYLSHISKGCEICGGGKWSCLFITNKCNAGCFYCPAPQLADETPSTQGINFNDPEDYAAYINYFRFQGASFSGGEPLLYFDRTLSYLKALRKRCASNLYIWMYSNGILASRENLQTLANENLDEIRFDIGATGFSLDKVKLAKGIIPNITIEIPAIPEAKDRLIALMPAMIEAGVTNLNLHHLRLTLHNADQLVKRPYTIMSAEKPLVLESELAALEIIQEAKKQNLDLGINYCSFHFKNRFQKAGFRGIITRKLFPGAILTKNGYIREFKGSSLCYKTVKISNNTPGEVKEPMVDIEGSSYGIIISTVFHEKGLSVDEQAAINELLQNEPGSPPSDPLMFRIWQLEYIEKGLRDY